MEHFWRLSSFNCDNQWPLDNLAYYIDEIWTSIRDRAFYCTKALFIVYKRPLDLVFRHKRDFHNSGFATHAGIPIKTTRRRSVHWSSDVIEEPGRLVKTLQIIAGGPVTKLHLTYLDERVSASYQYIIRRINGKSFKLSFIRVLISS